MSITPEAIASMRETYDLLPSGPWISVSSSVMRPDSNGVLVFVAKCATPITRKDEGEIISDVIVMMHMRFPALLDEVERLTGERDLAITAIGDTARKLEGDVQYWQRKCERLTRERDAAEAALAEHAPGYTLDDVAQAVDAIMPPELAASWQAIVAPRVIIDGQPVSYEELAALEAAAQVAPPQTDDVDGLNPERLAAWKVAAANSLSAHQARAVLMGVPMPDHTKEKTDGA